MATVWSMASCNPVPARQVAVAWDEAPPAEQVTHWRVWQEDQILVTSFAPQALISISSSSTTITVTAINEFGESEPSQPLYIAEETLPPIPQPATYTLTVQSSADLLDWTNVQTIDVCDPPPRFFRVKIEPR